MIEVDLDLCALRPIHRTRAALRTVGEEFHIVEFCEPSRMNPLPGYSDEAWLQFVQSLDLELRYPSLEWTLDHRASRRPGTPFARFHQLYWSLDGLAEDTPTPGLGAFVHRVERFGGRVVFLSGRWLTEHKAPSLVALKRAGISNPLLVIGNPWHETLVSDPLLAVSDSRIKAWHQQQVLRDFGQPIAIIDDRASNRAAVQNAVATAQGIEALGVAIAIPGFTGDPVTANESLRVSTFEHFDETLFNGPPRPHLAHRYPGLGIGRPWNGLYEGLGRNSRSYVLPRLAGWHKPNSTTHDHASPAPFHNLIQSHGPGSLSESVLLDLCTPLVPQAALGQFESAMRAASMLAQQGLAEVYPSSPEGEATLRRILIAAWLHSRDIETLMRQLGYAIEATGVHDLIEFVHAREVIHLLIPSYQPNQAIAASKKYSPWLTRWAATLDPSGQVNVSLLNPALLVSFSKWSPSQSGPQDAMDVHRLSDHHEGDLAERYDPVESAVNNLLHQREGIHGVRKEPVVAWSQIIRSLELESGAEALTKTSVGRDIVRDAAAIALRLERSGALTPWGLVSGASFD